MHNYKFYTPPLLADCLVSCLPDIDYKSVIDICCGSWNLLFAAKKRFGQAEYKGVDIDIEAGNNCFDGAHFVCKDGREFAFNERTKYDLILSNPPFGYLDEDERFFENDRECKIINVNNRRYENEMIKAN